MKFQVPVIRTGYSRMKVEVEAPDMRTAQIIALNMAPDLEFTSEYDYEYDVEHVVDKPVLSDKRRYLQRK